MSFGRLENTPAPQPMSEINMTPLVDVMLVLVVIFMISAPLLLSAVKVDLPKVNGAASTLSHRFLNLSIDRSGQTFLNDTRLESAALVLEMQQSAGQHPDTEVRLRADSAVPYGRVVEVMGLVHQAGLHRIGFVASQQGNVP